MWYYKSMPNLTYRLLLALFPNTLAKIVNDGHDEGYTEGWTDSEDEQNAISEFGLTKQKFETMVQMAMTENKIGRDE